MNENLLVQQNEQNPSVNNLGNGGKIQQPAVALANSIKPVVINGMDISNINVQDLPQEIIDEMKDEDVNSYLANKSEEDKKLFNSRAGYVSFESVILSEEELKKRAEARGGVSFSFGKKQTASESVVDPRIEVKKEQTGNVIFGVKK